MGEQFARYGPVDEHKNAHGQCESDGEHGHGESSRLRCGPYFLTIVIDLIGNQNGSGLRFGPLDEADDETTDPYGQNG